MNRRRFLGLLGLAAAGTAIGYDPLTTTARDGLRHFFVPPPPDLPIPIEPEPFFADRHGETLGDILSSFGRTDPSVYDAFAGLDWMTQAVLDQMREQLHGHEMKMLNLRRAHYGDAVAYREPVGPISTLDWSGDITMGVRPVALNKNFSVESLITGREAVESRRYSDLRRRIQEREVWPIAAMLAQQIRERGIDVLQAQELLTVNGIESAVAVDHAAKLSVRGTRHFDEARGLHVMRFDVLGGSL